MNTVNNFMGVDVSKKTLDVCLLDADGQVLNRSRIANEDDAIAIFFGNLEKENGVDLSRLLVCMEHTGIYSNLLLDFLSARQARICLEMALQIKRSQGIQRGKSDRIDALRIAQYAHENQRKLRLWAPKRKEVQQLKALMVLRDRLIRILNQLQVPLKEGEDFMDGSIQKILHASCRASMASVNKDLKKVDMKINNLIRKDDKLNGQFNLLTSVTGIGKVIATQMIVSTNEFKSITEAKKFACYAGVAPFEHSSGTSIKGRSRVSKLANMEIKKTLYLGATSAIQYSDEIKAYFERKVAEGKKPMSVINAVGNKLISRAFACIKHNRPYEKIYKHAFA